MLSVRVSSAPRAGQRIALAAIGLATLWLLLQSAMIAWWWSGLGAAEAVTVMRGVTRAVGLLIMRHGMIPALALLAAAWVLSGLRAASSARSEVRHGR